MTPPKFGTSRSDYYFDKEKHTISKGLASVKYIGGKAAEELYEISQKSNYKTAISLIRDIDQNTSVNRRQVEELIQIDFFSDFGNQNELLRIAEYYYDTFKRGEAKKVAKTIIDGTPIESIVQKYSVGVTKSGGVAKYYTLLDVDSILDEIEDKVLELKLQDVSILSKMRHYSEFICDSGFATGDARDRRKLFVTDVKPLYRKLDKKQFGMSVYTHSVGSGKDARFTVKQRQYDAKPISKGDIIHCSSFERNGKFFTMTSWETIEKADNSS